MVGHLTTGWSCIGHPPSVTQCRRAPVRPNLLWSLIAPELRIYFMTMSKSNRLISISYQELEPPYGSEEPLLSIFRAMQFPTLEQIEEILRAETNLKR